MARSWRISSGRRLKGKKPHRGRCVLRRDTTFACVAQRTELESTNSIVPTAVTRLQEPFTPQLQEALFHDIILTPTLECEFHLQLCANTDAPAVVGAHCAFAAGRCDRIVCSLDRTLFVAHSVGCSTLSADRNEGETA